MRTRVAFGFIVIELFRFFQGIEHVQLPIRENCGLSCEFGQGFGLVGHDDHRGGPQSFRQNVTRLAIELDIRVGRHAFVHEVDVKIERKHQGKGETGLHA
jgi:hypothetical protein